MNDELRHELLSAFLDGEATDEERALVEEWLESSEEARGELQTLRDLSAMLASTVESAPEGFRQAVMRRIERDLLIGDGRPHSQGTTLPAAGTSVTRTEPGDGRGHAAWLAAAAALAATAAVVLMSVQFLDPGGNADPRHVADKPEPSPHDAGSALAAHDPATLPSIELEEQLRRKSLRTAEGAEPSDTPAATAPAASPVPTADGATELAAKDDLRDEAEPMLPRGDGEGDVHDVANGFGGTSPPLAKLQFDDSIADARVGDVVKALEARGEEVAVVRLTVVDRRAGLEALQILLARNDIILVPESEPLEDAKELPASEGTEADSLEAVFVEATNAQLVSTLSGMRELAMFRELEVETPIALTSLESYNRSEGRPTAERFLQEARQRYQVESPEPRSLAIDSTKPAKPTDPSDRSEAAIAARNAKPGAAESTLKSVGTVPAPSRAEARPAPAGPADSPTEPQLAERKSDVDGPAPGHGDRDLGIAAEKARLSKPAESGALQYLSVQQNVLVPANLADGAFAKRVVNGGAQPPASLARIGDPQADRFRGASRASIPPEPRTAYSPNGRVTVVFVLVPAMQETPGTIPSGETPADDDLPAERKS